MAKKKDTKPSTTPPLGGLGRASRALGPRDPRASHRNPQAAANTDQVYDPAVFKRDRRGRLTLRSGS